MRQLAGVVAAVVMAASAGCSAEEPPVAAQWLVPAASADAPDGRAFYEPPSPLAPGAAGDLVWAEPLDDPPPGGRGWRVLYHSRSLYGVDIAVSGVVLAPDREAPPGGFPVVSWAHGTTGAADGCAPSRLRNGEPAFADELLAAGYVVAATDYEGLGTPGPHPYLVGESEGRSVLDAAKAAAELEDVHASNEVVVWGYSQGGHAALFAGEIAPYYAPELDVVGVVAVAPASDLATLLTGSSDVPGFHAFVVTTAYAWAATNAGASLLDVLGPDAIERLDAIEEDCLFGVGEAYDLPLDELRTGDMRVVDPWPRLLHENEPGTVAVASPVLLVHGDEDPLIPVSATVALAERLCRLGAQLQLVRYPSADHGTVVGAARDDLLGWIGARFAGDGAPSSCDG